MAQALLSSGTNPLLLTHPKLTFKSGGYSYTIERKGDADTYSVTDGINSLSVPIRWVFGAKSQTYVIEYQGRLYESLVSYYQPIDALAVTMGDEQLHPSTLVQAMGRELSMGEARACFQCHATKAVANDQIQMTSLHPGLQCERCHTGADVHAQNAAKGNTAALPAKLSNLTSEDMSTFCGQCHRTFAEVVRDHLFGEMNVRFQPYRLAKSQCFNGSDKRISCVACHDPHAEVSTDIASYDAKCLACHPNGKNSAKVVRASVQPGTAPAKACPVATSKCASCHMEKRELPGGHMVFTDHYIRVVHEGERYPE